MAELNEVEFNKSLRLIAKSSIIVFVGVILSKVFLYLFKVIIARYFGPEVYGFFSISLMILTLFVVVSLFGLSEGLLRFIPIYLGKNEIKKVSWLLKTASLIALVSSIIFSFVLYFSAYWISNTIFHNPILIIYLKISAFVIPFLALSNIYLSVIRAFERITAYSFILNIFQNLVKLVFLLILIFFGLKSNSIMIAYLIGTMSMLAISYLFCKYKISELFGKFHVSKTEKKKIKFSVFAYSLPLMFSSIFYLVYTWIDSFVIGTLRVNGIVEVGIYNAAVPIALILAIFPELFMQMFYPFITKEYAKKNYKLIQDLSKQITKWIFIISLPIFIIMFIFPGAVINIFFGQKFLSSEFTLRILSLGVFISILNGFFTTLLSMAGKSKTIFANLIVTSLINLILNIILVPKYGIIGAATSTTIAWVLLTIVLFVQVRLVLGFVPLKKKLVSIFLISLVPALILIIVRQFVAVNVLTLIVLGILFVLVYLLAILLIKGFDRNDLGILRSIKRKIYSM
jgi:O-antigen/teichoic acid export membrane protein